MLLLVPALFASRVAVAQTENKPVERSAAADANPEPSSDLHLLGDVHGFGGRGEGGVGIGVSLLARSDVFVFGLRLEGNAELLGYALLSPAATAGVTIPLGYRFRLAALGEGGIDAYSGVGSSFLGGDPGAKAILPYLGGRAMLTRSWKTFELGLSFAYDEDLTRKDVTYSYYGYEGFFDDHKATHEETHRAGTYRVSLGVTLGARFDL